MPYVKPEEALTRISGFTREEIRPGIAEDREFLRDQAGSMSSTLRFLAREIELREDVVDEQAATLEGSLAGASEELASIEGSEPVEDAVADGLDRLNALETMDVYRREQVSLDACNEVLAAIDDHLEGAAARRVRRPVYEFIDTRFQLQRKILGRSSD